MRHVKFSAAVVVWGTATLVVSLIAHILSIASYVHPGGEKTWDSEVPEFPVPIHPAVLTLVKSPRLGLYANDSDWDSVLPHGSGFIYLPSHDAHYLVSHYHQLYCLRSLRHYFTIRQNLSTIDIAHADYCLIYLRQMVLCNVDLTLEPASHKQLTPEGNVANAVTGIGVTHQCHDWGQVQDYVESNYHEWEGTYNKNVSGTELSECSLNHTHCN